MKPTQAFGHTDSSNITAGPICAKARAIRTALSLTGVMILAGCGEISDEAPRRTAIATLGESKNLVLKLPDNASSSAQLKDAVPRISLRAGAQKKERGVIQAELEKAEVQFADSEYAVALFNVGGGKKEIIIEEARKELDNWRDVILDSDGTDAQMKMVSQVASELSGLGTPSEGVLIVKVSDEIYRVTPLETHGSMAMRRIKNGGHVSDGNTVLYVLNIE